MFLWPEFAAKFNAFRTAVQAQGGGDQGPDFWVRTLVNRWGGEAEPDREIILQALDDSPESISFRAIIERMDTRYRERVSEGAAEQRWASLPLLGPEEHQLVQYWTNWNKLGRGVTASGRRQRMVFSPR